MPLIVTAIPELPMDTLELRLTWPFYGEALAALDTRAAPAAALDALWRGAGLNEGPLCRLQRLGPEALLKDLQALYDHHHQDPRYRPPCLPEGLDPSDTSLPEPPAAPPPQAVVVEHDLGPAEPLVALLEEAGIRVERSDAGPARLQGLIRLDGLTLAATDGRCATERAAQSGEPLVVFDLAPDPAGADVIALAPADQTSEAELARGVGLFRATGRQVVVLDDHPGLLLTRTLARLALEAARAVEQGRLSAPEADHRVREALGLPLGPLAWAQRVGPRRVVTLLDHLADLYGGEVYRAPIGLRRRAAAGAGLDLDPTEPRE